MVAHNPKEAVSIEELLVSSFAQADALAKLLIEKGSLPEKSLCKISERLEVVL